MRETYLSSVLLDVIFSTKSDLYSFGVVMWEILMFVITSDVPRSPDQVLGSVVYHLRALSHVLLSHMSSLAGALRYQWTLTRSALRC